MLESNKNFRDLDLLTNQLGLISRFPFHPLKMSPPDGDLAELDDLFSFREYNNLMRHFQGAGFIGNPQSGVIQYRSDLGIWYGYNGADQIPLNSTYGDDIVCVFGDDDDYGIVYNETDDTWEFLNGVTVGAGQRIIIHPDGEINMPSQPAVLVTTSGDGGVTGDGTAFTINWQTEIKDQNADFATPNFVAPKTGLYPAKVLVTLADMNSDVFGQLELSLITSNRTYRLEFCEPENLRTGGVVTVQGSIDVDMDAADIAYVVIDVGTGTKTIDTTANQCYFSIRLAV